MSGSLVAVGVDPRPGWLGDSLVRWSLASPVGVSLASSLGLLLVPCPSSSSPLPSPSSVLTSCYRQSRYWRWCCSRLRPFNGVDSICSVRPLLSLLSKSCISRSISLAAPAAAPAASHLHPVPAPFPLPFSHSVCHPPPSSSRPPTFSGHLAAFCLPRTHMMASAGIIPVANETQSSSTRITKEGRKITYRMKVIQQPERARACGSGAKSSADRRPVDPPPIVELRVYEGPNGENDITFSYKANFFLFTSLENARHLSQGRVPAQSQPSFPVLTGTPVAGMAYLDRPTPAGYFIFPDLSVRHEGKYRLSFSLYEELKEKEDMDSEIPEHVEQQRSAHVSHRLEVRSTPFTVFSAKKFPGLTESTQLSRIVAEQGCRVRIRRDVRMRRRGGDGKGGADDYDEGYNEQPYDRRASATPDYNAQHRMGTPHQAPVGDMDRPRSTSNASNASYAPQRRPSAEQISHTYPQPYATSPVTPQTPQGMYPPQSQASQWHGQPSQPVSYMQPPPPSYPQQSYQAPQSQQSMAPPTYGYMQPQYPSYEQNNGRHNSAEYPQPPSGPPRSTSTPQPQVEQQNQYSNHGLPPYGATAGNYSQPPTTQVSPIQSSHPAMPAPSQSYNAPAHSPVIKQDATPQFAAAAVPEHSQQRQEYYDSNRVVPPKFAHQPQPSGATKRSYASTFDVAAMEQPLRHGARPSVTAHDAKYSFAMDSGGDDEISIEESAMSYRRADGTERRRQVPLVN